MDITIKIDTDNHAFVDNPEEIQKILNTAYKYILAEEKEVKLLDSNQNVVGSLEITNLITFNDLLCVARHSAALLITGFGVVETSIRNKSIELDDFKISSVNFIRAERLNDKEIRVYLHDHEEGYVDITPLNPSFPVL